MFSKHNATKHAHLLLPGIAVSIVYTAFFAIPQQRERRRMSAISQQHSASIEKLRALVKAQEKTSPSFLPDASDLKTPLPTTTHGISLNRNEPTFVQGFAKLVSIFQSHGVDCTGADPDQPDSETKIDSVVTQRVSLKGRFVDVLASMEAIRNSLPHVLAAELSMKRPDPSGQCTWTIAFRFEEVR